MWPKGAPLNDKILFYKLPQVFQSMYTMDLGTRKFNDKRPVVNEPEPWNASGGLHASPRNEWRNVTGLELPGKILVWEEETDVGAPATVPKVRWKFPTGTKAYDVLIKDDHIFEIRVHEKLEDSWDDGTIYRPKGLKGEKQSWTWAFNEFDARSTTYTGVIGSEFEPTRDLILDPDFYPSGYKGIGLGCNKCHNKVGESTSYANARRGDDGRFTWHPFDANGNIDYRWPITRR